MRSEIVILAGMACLLPRVGIALEANEIFKLADPSIVVITTTDKNGKDARLGSGVLVAPRDVVTNCHVVKDAAGIVVKQPGVQRSGKLRYQDTARDLCQIQLDDALPAAKPVSAMLPSARLEVGQQVYAIGAPQGLDRTLSRGIISALRDMKDNAKLIQTDASVTNGSSGGGLFDSEGRLIGIVTFIIGEEGNLNFAIPADWIEQLATRNRDRTMDTVAAVAPLGTQPAVYATPNPAYPQTGDRWIYSVTTDRRNMGRLIVEAVGISPGQVTERITRPGFASFNVERVMPIGLGSRQLTALTLPGGYVLAELHPYLAQHEIKVGDRWNALPGRFFVPHITQRDFILNAQVMTREKVQTAAGEFDAWRIEAISGAADSGGIETRIRCTWWLSPSMKRSVKMRVKVESPYVGGQSDDVYNLIAFEPGH
jgi:serine protease Do